MRRDALSPVGMHHATLSRRHPSQRLEKYGQRGRPLTTLTNFAYYWPLAYIGLKFGKEFHHFYNEK